MFGRSTDRSVVPAGTKTTGNAVSSVFAQPHRKKKTNLSMVEDLVRFLLPRRYAPQTEREDSLWEACFKAGADLRRTGQLKSIQTLPDLAAAIARHESVRTAMRLLIADKKLVGATRVVFRESSDNPMAPVVKEIIEQHLHTAIKADLQVDVPRFEVLFVGLGAGQSPEHSTKLLPSAT